MPHSGCEVAGVDIRCGHLEMWPTEFCEDHKIDRNWQQCRRIRIIPFQLFRHICSERCGGISIMEMDSEPKADAECNEEVEHETEDQPETEDEQETEEYEEDDIPLLPPKLSPLPSSLLLRLGMTNDCSDADISKLDSEEPSDPSKIATADIPDLSLGASIDDSDGEGSLMRKLFGDSDEEISDSDVEGSTDTSHPSIFGGP